MRLLIVAEMSVAIKPVGSQFDIPRYLNTDRTLGVFVDVRCPNQNVSGIFDEVRIPKFCKEKKTEFFYLEIK